MSVPTIPLFFVGYKLGELTDCLVCFICLLVLLVIILVDLAFWTFDRRVIVDRPAGVTWSGTE